MKGALIALVVIILLITATTSFAGVCGDVNADSKLNLLDVSYIINHLYRSGPEPNCGPAYIGVCGDVNGDSKLNLLDVSYIINYLYRGGPKPDCGPERGTVTDIDGNVYQTVKIGEQWWMMENLKVTHYQNGDTIPNITDNDAWTIFDSGAYCDYDNDPNISAIYGRLYNGYVVLDGRNIAPEGWHVPSDAEWKQLEMYLGMSQAQADAENMMRGTTEGGKLKEAGTAHWLEPNDGATNESGFTALPAGARILTYYTMGDAAWFWTSTPANEGTLWYRILDKNNSFITRGNSFNIESGYSVRCVKD